MGKQVSTKTEFKVWDRVIYTSGNHWWDDSNPKWVVWTITKLYKELLYPIAVIRDNWRTDSYESEDLELYSKQKPVWQRHTYIIKYVRDDWAVFTKTHINNITIDYITKDIAHKTAYIKRLQSLLNAHRALKF